MSENGENSFDSRFRILTCISIPSLAIEPWKRRTHGLTAYFLSRSQQLGSTADASARRGFRSRKAAPFTIAPPTRRRTGFDLVFDAAQRSPRGDLKWMPRSLAPFERRA
jgi:hypothetical protein